MDSRTEDEVELGWRNASNEVAIIFPMRGIRVHDSAVNDSAKNNSGLVVYS
jgi:hypothetical protein